LSRVLVAMSGGVDSSVAAALLVEAGYEVIGATMKTFCYSDTPGHGKTCCGLDGITDAKRVAHALGIPHYVFDVEEAFTRDVVEDFVSEYAMGRTPNPCVRCNGNTKFRDLMARGRALGCDRIASGHYVRVEHHPHASHLLRGLDPSKDQAYFLWGLPPSLVSKLLFPVGALTKGEVRARAKTLGLVTADKPESQEICFVPTGDYRDLLRKRLDTHPALESGDIVRRDGEVVGRHTGYGGYTVGQRRGLGGGFAEPLFVLAIRPERREVVVGSHDELLQDEVVVAELNWLDSAPPAAGDRVQVQLRYRAQPVAASVEGLDGDLRLALDVPAPAITPGQSAVVFDDDRLRGGGRIVRAERRLSASVRSPRRTPASPGARIL
jgi:tRNA-specific 2-thiouridylase